MLDDFRQSKNSSCSFASFDNITNDDTKRDRHYILSLLRQRTSTIKFIVVNSLYGV